MACFKGDKYLHELKSQNIHPVHYSLVHLVLYSSPNLYKATGIYCISIASPSELLSSVKVGIAITKLFLTLLFVKKNILDKKLGLVRPQC